MPLAIIVLALPVTYLVCLIAALNARPGWGTGILMVVVSLAAAILGAYAGVLGSDALWPGTEVYARTGNHVAGIVTCGPIAGMLALGVIWLGARLRRGAGSRR